MAVAFPVGIGLALVLGVMVNYFGAEKGNPTLLFTGVAFITLAILLNSKEVFQHTLLAYLGV
jgi:glucose uptake protein